MALSVSSLWILILLALSAWGWWYALQGRELARRHALQACRTAGLQLLDDSVSLIRLRPKRHRDSGRLGLLRSYRFEFSRNGSDRWAGHVNLHGQRLLDIELDIHQPVSPEAPHDT